MSNKEDAVIRVLAEKAERRGYQTISFDLPEHGERTADGIPCKVQHCINDLRKIMDYARKCWPKISLFGCSMGAYFSLREYRDELLDQALFLSPVVNMQRIIANMMNGFGVSKAQLEEAKKIQTPMGQMLYWDDYIDVFENPIRQWNCETSILFGAHDALCERDTIDDFVLRFGSRLDVLEYGEHYFHTPQQLAGFSAWLKQEIH